MGRMRRGGILSTMMMRQDDASGERPPPMRAEGGMVDRHGRRRRNGKVLPPDISPPFPPPSYPFSMTLFLRLWETAGRAAPRSSSSFPFYLPDVRSEPTFSDNDDFLFLFASGARKGREIKRPRVFFSTIGRRCLPCKRASVQFPILPGAKE